MISYLVLVVYSQFPPKIYNSADYQYAEQMFNALYGRKYLYKLDPDNSLPELLKSDGE